MPELPEVENVKIGLEKILPKGSKLKKVSCLRPNLRYPFPEKKSWSKIIETPLVNIERRAKYLLFRFSQQTLLSHLGMTGTWRFIERENDLKLHDHLVLQFTNTTLVYNDPRRFGFIEIFNNQNSSEFLRHLGIEPLGQEFNLLVLIDLIQRSKNQAIKPWLMNQKNIVGIGNIYASEILFLSHIHPQRYIHELQKFELKTLLKFTKLILQQAIQKGGSSIQDYRMVNGQSGRAQDLHRVYNREGLPCQNCQSPIRALSQAGRMTYLCEVCQK